MLNTVFIFGGRLNPGLRRLSSTFALLDQLLVFGVRAALVLDLERIDPSRPTSAWLY